MEGRKARCALPSVAHAVADGRRSLSPVAHAVQFLEATRTAGLSLANGTACLSSVVAFLSIFTKINSTRVSTSKSRACCFKPSRCLCVRSMHAVFLCFKVFVCGFDVNSLVRHKPSHQFITDSTRAPAGPARERSSSISLKRPHLSSLVCQNSARHAMLPESTAKVSAGAGDGRTPCCKAINPHTQNGKRASAARPTRNRRDCSEEVSRPMKRGVFGRAITSLDRQGKEGLA